MIPVEKQPEPRPPGFDFDARVRQRGQSALAELMGRAPTIRRPGPAIAKRVERLEDLDPQTLRDYAYWTHALDALYGAYRGICAYSCFRISPLGSPTVDHFVAITSAKLADAYEWDNYRLACSLMNSCKREFPDVLDPFVIQDGWFVLDVDTLEVEPAPGLAPELRERIAHTIARLKLNSRECTLTRRRYFDLYWNPPDPTRPVPLWFLAEEAPFLVREMRRQGRVRPEDLPGPPERPAAP